MRSDVAGPLLGLGLERAFLESHGLCHGQSFVRLGKSQTTMGKDKRKNGGGSRDQN